MFCSECNRTLASDVQIRNHNQEILAVEKQSKVLLVFFIYNGITEKYYYIINTLTKNRYSNQGAAKAICPRKWLMPLVLTASRIIATSTGARILVLKLAQLL
jgi:hypothetical protein